MQSPFLGKQGLPQLITPHFMEPDGSLSYSQKPPATLIHFKFSHHNSLKFTLMTFYLNPKQSATPKVSKIIS